MIHDESTFVRFVEIYMVPRRGPNNGFVSTDKVLMLLGKNRGMFPPITVEIHSTMYWGNFEMFFGSQFCIFSSGIAVA